MPRFRNGCGSALCGTLTGGTPIRGMELRLLEGRGFPTRGARMVVVETREEALGLRTSGPTCVGRNDRGVDAKSLSWVVVMDSRSARAFGKFAPP